MASTPKLDERFISKIKGREAVLYAGLLDLAHQLGLQKLEVDYIQIPSPANDFTAICRATAVCQDGRVFTDIGDANPSNVNKMIAPHVLRMASTRAKARALRDFTNIGITCIEELDETDHADPIAELRRISASLIGRMNSILKKKNAEKTFHTASIGELESGLIWAVNRKLGAGAFDARKMDYLCSNTNEILEILAQAIVKKETKSPMQIPEDVGDRNADQGYFQP